MGGGARWLAYREMGGQRRADLACVCVCGGGGGGSCGASPRLPRPRGATAHSDLPTPYLPCCTPTHALAAGPGAAASDRTIAMTHACIHACAPSPRASRHASLPAALARLCLHAAHRVAALEQRPQRGRPQLLHGSRDGARRSSTQPERPSHRYLTRRRRIVGRRARSARGRTAQHERAQRRVVDAGGRGERGKCWRERGCA